MGGEVKKEHARVEKGTSKNGLNNNKEEKEIVG